MTGIYLITNKLNNKRYVGQSINIKRRWSEHIRSGDSLVSKEIAKFGENNFKFEVLHCCEISELNFLEKQEIVKYNTLIPNGYNTILPNLDDVSGESFSFYNKEIIDAIIISLKQTELSASDISEKYGVHTRTVYHINKGTSHFREEENYPLRKDMVQKEGPRKCVDCDKNINSTATRCVECHNLFQRIVERPDKERLLEEVATNGFAVTGRKYGVSDNSIRKWMRVYGLPTKIKEVKQLFNR